MSRLSEITQEQRERLRENTARMAGGLPFIKYDEGKFLMGSTDVTGNDFVAVIDRCDAVWIHFSGGSFEVLSRVNLMDGKIPPRPEGYDDREKWEKWATGKDAGKPKNPLSLQYELPLLMEEDRRLIVFKASTVLTREAVQRLLDETNANEQLRRPYVTLEANPNPSNQYQTLPCFTITGYSDDVEDVALPGDKPKAAPTNGQASTGKPSRNSDMDDDIPFK